MPPADATAIFFFATLLIIAMPVPLLGETVGLRRWMAVLVGLIGVIIVVRPGTDAFQIAALSPLLAAFAYASLQILTRKLGVTERASTLAFYIQVTFVFVCMAIGLAVGGGRYAFWRETVRGSILASAWPMPRNRWLPALHRRLKVPVQLV